MRINLRKALALLVSLLMLCTLLPMGAMSVSAADANLSLNWNDGTLGFDKGSIVTGGPDGSNCFKWSATGGWSATYTVVKNMDPAKDYVITMKAKASVAGNMGITIQNGDWGSFWNGPTFAVTTTWQDVTVEIPANAYPFTKGSILFKFQDTDLAMDLYVDDLVIAEKVEEVPETPTTGENLVKNGSFENSNSNWSLSSFSSIVSGGQDGSYALQIQNPTTQYAGNAIQYVDVEPNKGYTLSWWSKRVSGTGVFNLYLDGAEKTAGGNAWMNETSGQWVQTVMDIKTTASATSLMLKFSNEAANTNGTILIDNVVLTKHPEASFDGFIYNGDFEIGTLQNWSIAQTATVKAEAAYSGSYGAHITNPGKGYGGMLYQGTEGIMAGKTYTISFWMKVTVGYVNYQILDGSVSGTKLAGGGYSTNSWKQFSITVTPATNIIYINFCGGATGNVDEAYIDDVMIVEEKDPSFDGYFYNGDFETGKANPYWTVYQSTTVTAAAKKEGSYGLKMAGSGSNYGGLAYQIINTLKTGKEYTISMWIKVVQDGVNVQVMNGSISGTVLASGYYDTNSTGDWKEITLTFTAASNTIALNFCGSGNAVANEIYIDNVTCGRVGGEVFPEELHQFGGNSIKENADGIGLAFKFDIKAINGQKDFSNQYVSGSAKIVLDESQFSVIRMGAVLTNDAAIGQSASKLNLESVNGKKIINIDGIYMANLTTETVSFAVRILDIPTTHQGTEIYARPYYVYQDASGQEVTVYGGIKSNTYAKVANPKSSIKILSIGHSFSKDVMKDYLWNMFKEGGYDEVVIGYLYMAGCSMPKHLYNIQNNLSGYEYGKNVNGTWQITNNATALQGLRDEEWDYVNIQSSPDYIGGQSISQITLGINSEGQKVTLNPAMTEYECITPITDWIKDNATNSSVKTDYHMIWSFSQDCELWSYTYHDYDQIKMYNNIITQTKQNVLTHEAINDIIPCATSIQNARSSFIGDNFNEVVVPGTQADGYHLNTKYGDYTGALTWYCHYSGDDANVMSGYKGQLTDAEFAAIAEAVNNAMDTWDEITESTHK